MISKEGSVLLLFLGLDGFLAFAYLRAVPAFVCCGGRDGCVGCPESSSTGFVVIKTGMSSLWTYSTDRLLLVTVGGTSLSRVFADVEAEVSLRLLLSVESASLTVTFFLNLLL